MNNSTVAIPTLQEQYAERAKHLVTKGNIVWQRSPLRCPIAIGNIDVQNVVYHASLCSEDTRKWEFRSGGFRETVYLLCLAGF